MVGCQTDETHLNTNDSPKNYLINEYNYTELENNTLFRKEISKIEKAKLKFKDNNEKNKGGDYGFTIDSSSIKEVSLDGYRTYTMLINRDSPSIGYFENLVIEINADSVKTYIFKYTPDKQIEHLDDHVSFSFMGEIDVTPIDYVYDTNGTNWRRPVAMCTAVKTLFCNWGGDVHIATSNCTASYTFEVTTSQSCSDGSDSGGGGGNGDGSNTNNTNNTGDTSTIGNTQTGHQISTNGNITTFIVNSPIAPPQYQLDANTIKLCTNAEAQFSDLATYDYWIKRNQDFASDAAAFIDSEGCTIETAGFVEEAFEAFMDGSDVDFEDQIIYDSTFNKYPCQKIIIKNATNNNSVLSQTLNTSFSNNSNVNLVYTISNTINGSGQTDHVSTYNPNTRTCDIQVRFKESYVKTATDLSIAATAMHESIHAILVFMYEEGSLGTNINSTNDPYTSLVDAYIKYLGGLPSNLGIPHHEIMSGFQEDIATTLSIYGQQQGYLNSFSFYKKISWLGLLNTSEFKNLYPKYINSNDPTTNPNNFNPEWFDINQTIAAEQNNSQLTFLHPNGTTYTHSPKGNAPNASEPCN